VLALTAAGSSSAWNAGGSILTFYFPVGLFVIIGALLCLQYARPHQIPGHEPLALTRSDSFATPPGQVAPDGDPEQPDPETSPGEPEALKADG
jgi:hypothetical protein